MKLCKGLTEGQLGLIKAGSIRLEVISVKGHKDDGMIRATRGDSRGLGRSPRQAVEALR